MMRGSAAITSRSTTIFSSFCIMASNKKSWSRLFYALKPTFQLLHYFGQRGVFHVLKRQPVRLKGAVAAHVLHDLLRFLARDVKRRIIEHIHRSYNPAVAELESGSYH